MQRATGRYSSQIWLLFWGALTGSTGQSLVWPFLVIFIREQLDVPLSAITPLFTIQSIAGIVATTAISPLMDRTGRKLPMIGGLFLSGVVLLAMSQAHALWHWAILLGAYGMVNQVFRVGAYAMVADMIPPEDRARVYALLRMGDNAGIAIGPTMGGFLVSVAYVLSYSIAAASQFLLAILVWIMIRETLQPDDTPQNSSLMTVKLGGYGTLLRDRPFMRTWGLYILAQIANTLVFVLLGVYVKENYGISENRFGFIVGANAVMVVCFQYAVTQITVRRQQLPVLAVGASFYAFGMLTFAASRSFPAFLLGMVIFTIGELVLVPTATALVANLAPSDMRARYIGMFTLSFRVAAGIGPVYGGLLADHIAPVATWYGGFAASLLSALGFVWMYQHRKHAPVPKTMS